ncbi:hypothetical protein [Streptomyces sp. NPDC093707]|uniref:hypothetical protein n=1 Tax=Streptomyces sp. NPDC093707 TaxID=3154984 RepID=UPI00344FB597
MIPVPPLPDVRLAPDWRTATRHRTRHAQQLHVAGRSGAAEVRLERCAAGRLRDAYPVGSRDLEVRADACAEDVLPGLLTALADALGATDPRCRRLVFAAPADDRPRIAAAESAGFRHVVEIDLGTDAYRLMTWEPAWATCNDPDLDRVPGA